MAQLIINADLIEGESIAKDEIHRALNVAILVVMPPDVVVKRVLRAQKFAPDKRCGVPRYSQCHRLLPHRSRFRHWCCVLPKTKEKKKSFIRQ